MKIGLIISGHGYIGGVHQFETTVLSGLRDFAGQSGHTFTVLNAPPGFREEEFETSHLRFSNMIWPTAPILRRALAKGVRMVRNPLGGAGQTPGDLGPPMLRREALAEEFEVLYYLVPQPIEADLPSILTIYDLQHRLYPEFPEVSAGGRWRSREQMYSTLISRASTVLAITEESKREVVELYHVRPERIKVLPMVSAAVALPDGDQQDSTDVLSKYGIPSGFLFYPAHFWPHKNHVGLLMAVQLIRERHGITIPVVFTGRDQGNERHVKQVMEELGLGGQVHFLGFVTEQTKSALYRQALALTMVSFFGPANIPPLEAFALECPVINSDFRGSEEHIGDAGLLVDPRDPTQIAEAIKALYEDESLRQTLIDRGLARSRAWTIRDYCEGVLSILDELEALRRCWSNSEPYALPTPPRAR